MGDGDTGARDSLTPDLHPQDTSGLIADAPQYETAADYSGANAAKDPSGPSPLESSKAVVGHRGEERP